MCAGFLYADALTKLSATKVSNSSALARTDDAPLDQNALPASRVLNLKPITAAQRTQKKSKFKSGFFRIPLWPWQALLLHDDMRLSRVAGQSLLTAAAARMQSLRGSFFWRVNSRSTSPFCVRAWRARNEQGERNE
jgi:hypothetical protein